jgi:sulfopyruvate decarboxylase alpha subunit
MFLSLLLRQRAVARHVAALCNGAVLPWFPGRIGRAGAFARLSGAPPPGTVAHQRGARMNLAEGWPDPIHRALGELGVRQVAYVPDAGHARLIELCRSDPEMRAVPLTTEEEGVALAAGAWLGGQRAVLLMQSSGVGNCVNMLALNQVGRFPLLALVTMRGEWGEQNPWQLAMGQSAADVLKTAGVIVQRLDAPESAGDTVHAAGAMAFEGQVAVAVLIGQRLIGAKSFDR